MGIISQFGNWITRIFVPEIPQVSLTPGASPAGPAKQEFLNAREGAVLVKEEGVAVLYPPYGTADVDEKIVDTLDFLRHALARQDWMNEWYEYREELDEIFEDEEGMPPVLTVLDGGRAGEPRGDELGPFAVGTQKDPQLSE